MTSDERPQTRVRPGTAEDAAAAAAIAIAEVTWSPITRLGPGFMTMMYRHMFTSPWSFGEVAERDGEMVGFNVASIDSRRYFRHFVLRRGPGAALRLLPRVVVPKHARTIWRGLTYSSSESHVEDPPGELLGIVLSSRHRGTGAGRALMEALFARYRELGIERIKIADIDADNDPANAFFLALGAVFHRRETVYGGNEVNVLHCPIPSV